MAAGFSPDDYDGYCDRDDIQCLLQRIEPGNTEYNFWLLAVRIIQEDAGWGGYNNIVREFENAVRNRDYRRGTLNFARDIPSLGVRNYTQALREITRLLTTTFHQWVYRPSQERIHELIVRANQVMTLRVQALETGRARRDDENVISCHEYALTLWEQLVSGLERQADEL